mgnify:FL=1
MCYFVDSANERFRDVGFYVGSDSLSLAQSSNLCYYQVDVVAAGSLTTFPCTMSQLKLYNQKSKWEYFKRGQYILIQLNYSGAVLHVMEVYVEGYSLQWYTGTLHERTKTLGFCKRKAMQSDSAACLCAQIWIPVSAHFCRQKMYGFVIHSVWFAKLTERTKATHRQSYP